MRVVRGDYALCDFARGRRLPARRAAADRADGGAGAGRRCTAGRWRWWARRGASGSSARRPGGLSTGCAASSPWSSAAARRPRLARVLDRIRGKIVSELRPRDLAYQILDGLHQLVDYDHSSAFLT